MKSIALGRMLKDGRHVVGCRYSLDDALLGARLKRLGLEARLYSGKGEGRVVDLARQFVRMRCDAFLFAVEPDTASLLLQMARQVRALLPAARIFCRGDLAEAQRQTLDLDALGASWLPEGIDDGVAAISTLIGRTGDDAPIDEACSPYLSGLVHEDDLGRIGLSADQPLAIFSKELAWLSRKTLAADLTIPVRAVTRNAVELAAIDEMIKESGVRATLAIQSNHREDPEGSPASPSAYGVNGVIALHTGLYGDPISGIRHLEVSGSTPADQRQAAYAWAAPNLASRSALVFQQQGESHDLDRFTAPLTPETSGWPMHSYVIESTPIDGSVVFDGDSTTRQDIRSLPLAEFESGADATPAITFLSLTRTADVDAFERRLRRFTESGRIHIGDPTRQVYFENSCRWTRRGTCQLTSLKRLQLREGGRLSACRDAGEVGALTQSHDEIVVHLKRDQQTQGIRRECAVCAVRDDCSQCTQLPSDWAGRYCSIRKQHPSAPLFIEIFSMAHGLASLFGAGAGADLDLQVSYSGLPNQHFSASTAERRDGQRPVILSANGKHIAWWRGTRRLCRLSAPLALMAEAWWSSGTEAEIVGDLSAKFSVTTDVATASLETGAHKLRAEGIIHA